MANYNLTINSKFQPFSFERYLQPYQIYGQAYSNMENQYADMLAKANIWDKLDEEKEEIAYSIYQSFVEDLKQQAEQLSKEGLSPLSRQNIFKMKGRYSSDIIPIEQAFLKRQKLIEQQQELKQRDPNYIIEKDASQLSLDDLIKNPEWTYDSISGSKIFDMTKSATQGLSKIIRNNPDQWREILNGQYFEQLIKSGYSPEEIIQSLENDKNAPVELRNIIDNIVESTGVKKWDNPNAEDQVYKYIGAALWGNALGTIDSKTLANRGKISLDEIPPKNPYEFASAIGNVRGIDTSNLDEKMIDLVDGFTRAPGGYTTNKLSKLDGEISKLENSINQLYAKMDKGELNRWESRDLLFSSDSEQSFKQSAPGLSIFTQAAKTPTMPQGYKQYKDQKEELKEKIKERDELLQQYKDLEEKFKHLSDDPYTAMNIGITLERIKNTPSIIDYSIPSIKDQTIKSILRGTAISDKEDTKNPSFIDEKGKPVKKRIIKEMMEHPDQVYFGNENNKFIMQFDGETYHFNTSLFKNMEHELKSMQDFLQDFTKSGLSKAIEIKDSEDIGPIIDTINLNEIKNLGRGYYGIDFITTGGNYIKFIINREKKVEAYNDLNTYLESNGANVGEETKRLIEAQLNSLHKVYQQENI